MLTNHERVSQALDVLTSELTPYVEKAMKSVYQDRWISTIRSSFRRDLPNSNPKNNDTINWDAHSLLTVMWDQWNTVFRSALGHSERSLVSELRESRNRWAHQQPFDFDDTYRLLDSAIRLLTAIDSPGVTQLASSKRDILLQEFNRDQSQKVLTARFQRQKLGNVIIYMICCAALLVALISTMGSMGWLIGIPLVALFAHFSVRLLLEKPVLYGPHDCTACGKIIYSQECPYCQVAQLGPN
ncbi:MAG: Swt1 family HEPN domain-containing protein [Planctomycetaceae bacterium]